MSLTKASTGSVKVKQLCKVIDVRAGSRRPPLLAVSIHRGVVPRSALTDDEPRADDLSGYKLCEAGDLVLNRMRAFQGAIGMTDGAGMVSPDYLVLRPIPKAEARFLHYLFRSSWFVGEMVARLRGIGSVDTGMVRTPRINAEDLFDIRVAQPPPAEQRAIADYLDRETARIDALTASKRHQTDRLGERVGSAVQEAIDRSRAARLSLRRVVSAFVDYRGATPEKSASGVPLITATNVANGRIDLARGEQFVSEETYATWMRRGFPEVGDVLLTTEAPLGEVAAIEDPRVALAQRIILLKPNRDRVLPGFLRIALLSAPVQADLRSRASGSTVWGIRADRLRDVQVPIPELRDQQIIIRLAREAEQVSVAGAELITRQIRLLAERRQALITAAVTGNLPIPVSA